MEKLLLKAPELSKYRLPPRIDTRFESQAAVLWTLPYLEANIPDVKGQIESDTLDTCWGRTTWKSENFDRYRAFESIQSGGFSETFKAYDQSTGDVVCIKRLLVDFQNNDKFRKAAIREGILLHELKHPNLVKGRNVFEYEGNIYTVMDYICAPTLEEFIQEKRRNQPYKIPLNISDVVSILKQSADAHMYLNNNGVIHGDTNPHNLLFDGTHLTMIDLGGANVVCDSSDGSVIFTPAYRRPVSPSTLQEETYSMGAVLFEMLTGDQLYQRATIEDTIETHNLKRNLKFNLAVLEARLINSGIDNNSATQIKHVVENAAYKNYKSPEELCAAFTKAAGQYYSSHSHETEKISPPVSTGKHTPETIVLNSFNTF